MTGRNRAVAAVAVAIGIFLFARSYQSERDTVERVAEVEHEQWTTWSKDVAPEVSPERQARWRQYWIPYKDLPEPVKEQDRVWARKAIAAAKGK